MKKKIKIVSIVFIIFVLICMFLYSKDNIRFKIDYELYNKTTKIKVNIPINNKVKYLKGKKIVSFLKEGTGVIYFGYSSCPWCRNSVPILIDSIKENKINTLYYVDMHNSDIDSIQGDLYEILEDYLRETDSGKVLAVPDVYVVKNGKILSHHRGTVESYKNPYKGMSDKQKKELKKIYNDMIGEIK